MISIQKSKDLDQINIDELKDSLQAHEHVVNKMKQDAIELIL